LDQSFLKRLFGAVFFLLPEELVSEEVDVVSSCLLVKAVDLIAALAILTVYLVRHKVNVFLGEIVQDLILHLTAVVPH
jgi:hypothetical protein